MGLEPSVVSQEDIRQLLARHYQISGIRQIEVLAGGDDYCYHIVAPEQEWVLKEMRVNGMNRPEQEPGVAEQLRRDELPVPHYYRTVDGEYVWHLQGRAFHLQQFISGKIHKRNQAPPWLLGEAAELLGRIHRSLASIPPLPDGMGLDWYQDYEAAWTRDSYGETVELAERQGETSLARDARYRLSLMPFLESFALDFEGLTRRNTHGDYHLRQLICGERRVRAVIDLTTACVNPVIWELIRSYTSADPHCQDGAISVDHLKEYIARYLAHSYLGSYDLRMMPSFYFYQLLRCNYIQQYFEADASGKSQALDLAIWSTQLCRWLEAHCDSLADELSKSF